MQYITVVGYCLFVTVVTKDSKSILYQYIEQEYCVVIYVEASDEPSVMR